MERFFCVAVLGNEAEGQNYRLKEGNSALQGGCNAQEHAVTRFFRVTEQEQAAEERNSRL
ncbi:hypothetical protein DVH26_05650 [Paenibacillus sp. H1-7]|nr:hypothetical protein DVH26_05650 [Paenibacillus sp. H1-7]